jgi:uncharacterized damage-inducible protein DinB
MNKVTRPAATDYATAFAGYIAEVTEEDVLAALAAQSTETQKLLASLDESKAAYRYAEAKWSVKEVLGHMTDTERIMGYRALAIGRGDTQPLPGFDEKEYVRNASFDAWKLGDLAEQYALVRRSTLLLFRNLPDDAWDRRGTANGHEITPRALAWVVAGHELHHVKVLRERYRV